MKIFTASSNNVPGYTNYSLVESIKSIASRLPANSNILEIGSALGKSTTTWMESLNPMSTITVIDTFALTNVQIEKMAANDENYDNCKEIYNYFLKFGHYATWKYIINRHPNKNMIKEVFSMRSETYINEKYNNNYNLVFLDVGHDYNTVMMELEYFKSSDIICGDDYKSIAHPDVKSAVDDFCSKNNFKKELMSDNMMYVITKG